MNDVKPEGTPADSTTNDVDLRNFLVRLERDMRIRNIQTESETVKVWLSWIHAALAEHGAAKKTRVLIVDDGATLAKMAVATIMREMPGTIVEVAPSQPPDVRGASVDVVEAAAKAIYDHWEFRSPVSTPAWIERGNSLAQERARAFARAALATASKGEGHD